MRISARQGSLSRSVRWFGAVLTSLAATVLAGCSGEAPAPAQAPVPVEPAKLDPPKPADPPKPKPAEVWATRITAGEALLAAGDFAKLDEHLKSFDSVYPESEGPGEEQAAALTELKSQLAAKREEANDARRSEQLAAAREFLGKGKYEEATQALNAVNALAPTAEQREEAATLTAEIETRRNARRRLATWMQLLASDDRKQVRTAQTQLHREAEAAMPLLLESVQDAENPQLVANTLELLRRMQRPETTLPAMLGVLKREEQSKNWSDAVREIGRASAPGLGGELLTLATTAKNPEQRSAALAALGQVPDPPAETLVRLLPRIFEDAPDLPAALQAAAQAVRQHRQLDIVARRGIDGELTEEEDHLLGDLAERLTKIVEAGAAENPPSDAVVAARALGMAIRIFHPKPIEPLKLHLFAAESENGKAEALLDGVWNKTDYPTMWRHPIDRRSSIILDLGEERTVEGVRIWNFNEPGGTHRGWKEVDIYVSSTETALTPVAEGIVPMAPGVADTPDYSVLVPVPSVRGRYVRLEARSIWRPDTYTGLSEVQVLGW